MERKARAAATTGIYLAVVAAILVVANVLSYGAYKRFDMTKSERFTLSKGSARLVSELKQDLQMDVYVTRGLPKHDAFIQDLTDLLNEYEKSSKGKAHYTLVEPKTDEQRAAAKEAGLQDAAFGDVSATGADSATITRGYMGIAFKYGSEKDVIPILSPDQSQGLEFWITNKIREVRDRADGNFKKFGVLTGKDEIKLSEPNLVQNQRGPGPSMKSILEQALPFYKFEDVDLQNGEAEINKELDGILITQPGKDYTEKELRRIDQFLMRGDKSLVVIAGAVNMKASDPAMKAELNLHGLDKLMEGYGVEMKKEAILEWGASIVIPFQYQSGQIGYARLPGILQAQHVGSLDDNEQILDSSFAGFFRLDELAFPFPSTLVPHGDKQPTARVKVVARTTPRASGESGDTIEMKLSPEWKPKPPFAQRAVAIAIEPGCCDGSTSCGDGDPCKAGKIKSAYGGKEGEGVTGVPAESPGNSRILVISAPQFLANPFARAGNPPPMPPQLQMMGGMGGDEQLLMLSQPYAQKYLTSAILSFKNVLDWMSGDADLIATSAKLLGETNLTYSDISKPKEEAADDEASIAKKNEEYKNQRNRIQQQVQWTLTLFPAFLFAAYGILRWWMRENNRSKISLD